MKIENAKGAQMSSKLAGLIDSFTASPFKVAPEREQDMVEIRDRFDLRISIDDRTKDWIFEAQSYFGARHEIKLSLRSLERLWGWCYAYTAIVTELQESDTNGTDVNQSREYILAFELLDWIAQDTLENIECPWPDHLPNPEHSELRKHVKLADHFFLMTAGRILLHEIAHLVLDHFSDPEPTNESLIKDEYDADAWADDWMLGRWEDNSNDVSVFIGRTMGIAFNHAIILFFGSKQKSPSNTHPNPIDRLNAFVSKYLPLDAPSSKNPKHCACGLLLAIIGHLVNKSGATPDFGDLSTSYPEIFVKFRSQFN